MDVIDNWRIITDYERMEYERRVPWFWSKKKRDTLHEESQRIQKAVRHGCKYGGSLKVMSTKLWLAVYGSKKDYLEICDKHSWIRELDFSKMIAYFASGYYCTLSRDTPFLKD